MVSSVCHRRRKLVWECFPASSIVSVEERNVEAAKPGLCANTVAGTEAGPEILTPLTVHLNLETLWCPGASVPP